MKHVDVRPVVDCVSAVLRLNHKMYGSRKAQTSSWFVSSRESMDRNPIWPACFPDSGVRAACCLLPTWRKVGLGWATETILLLRCFVFLSRMFEDMNFFGACNDYFSIKILQIFQYTG